MRDTGEAPFFSGRPMDTCSLRDQHAALRVLPRGARLVTIEEDRENLPKVTRWLAELQAMSDEAHDL